jgi:hypothetical protein
MIKMVEGSWSKKGWTHDAREVLDTPRRKEKIIICL